MNWDNKVLLVFSVNIYSFLIKATDNNTPNAAHIGIDVEVFKTIVAR